jgi:hypothetical protein
MYPEHPNFDLLDFTSSKFGKPEFDKSSIRVPVQNLLVSKKLLNSEHDQRFENAVVIFENVRSSQREISIYGPSEEAGSRYQHKVVAEQSIVDGPFEEVDDNVFLFYLGGFSYEPQGWIEWDIVAASFRLET